MNKLTVLLILFSACSCVAGSGDQSRREAEYYVAAYAVHYSGPIEFVRAIIDRESRWQRCPVSSKGAIGLMQLMPDTACRLNVQNRCDLSQNVSGGVRYLAWLMGRFHGDLRLVAAAYYAGESVVERRGLKYSNPDVVSYVLGVRENFEHEKRAWIAESWAKGRTR